jgi:hypothetical protein
MHWFYLEFETLLLMTRLLVTLPFVTWNERNEDAAEPEVNRFHDRGRWSRNSHDISCTT